MSPGWPERLQRPSFLLVLVAVACVVVYSPARNGPFVYDDVRNIVENPHVRMARLDPGSLWQALVPYKNLNLRPLSFLTFALNHLAGGYSPFGYRVVNLAVLLLSIPVAYLLALRLSSAWTSAPEARATALGATAVWALHPLLINGVSYVVQRMTALYALFGLASLLFFLQGRRSGRSGSYALAAASLLCALASKETALVIPLLAILMLWLLPREQGGAGDRAGWVLAGLVVASQIATFFVAQHALQARWVPAQEFSSVGMTERVLTEGRVVLRYLELFILPLPSKLTFDYAFPPSTSLLAPPTTLLAAAFHVALVALAVWARRRRPLLAFGILAFYLLQLPEGTFMPLDLIFEHRAYLPAFFLALSLADLLQWVGGRRGALAVALALAALWGACGYQRNQVWADSVTLWADTVAKAPRNPRAHFALGVVLAERGQVDEAIAHFRTALEISPDAAQVHNNLGAALAARGQADEAFAQFEKALELTPNSAQAHNNFGFMLAARGQMDDAIAHFRTALQINPDLAQAHNSLGLALLARGETQEAIEHFRQALKSRPDYAEAKRNLGAALAAGKR